MSIFTKDSVYFGERDTRWTYDGTTASLVVGGTTAISLLSTGFSVFTMDAGAATASSSAATLSQSAGKITSEALTTAAQASETLTITNTLVAAADMVVCTVANGTNTQGVPVVGETAPGAGSFTVEVENQHASEALNGTVVVSFAVIKLG